MNLNQYCPGCGGGEGKQACSIAKCSLQHGNVEYCFQCESYPCERYEDIDELDSFITHHRQNQDMEKFRKLGVELYSAEQQRKKFLLNHILNTYNDGRKKMLFCVAANLLELDDLENIINELDKDTPTFTLKEKSAHASNLIQKIALNKNISLKLRKKNSTK